MNKQAYEFDLPLFIDDSIIDEILELSYPEWKAKATPLAEQQLTSSSS